MFANVRLICANMLLSQRRTISPKRCRSFLCRKIKPRQQDMRWCKGGEPETTKKQKRFIEEYLIDLNATQAAIRAGYSPETAYSIGQENLKKPEIAVAVAKAMAERSKRTGVNADRVVLELARIGFAKITDVIDPKTATIKEDALEDDLACIQSVKIKPNEWGTEREVKLCDKKAALELLGKHLGMFKDRVELSGSLEDEKTKLDDILQQIRDRQ